MTKFNFQKLSMSIGALSIALGTILTTSQAAFAQPAALTDWFNGRNLARKGDVVVDSEEPVSTPEPASLLALLAVGAFGAKSALKRKKSS